jgi:small conductance mechanosensitive channel
MRTLRRPTRCKVLLALLAATLVAACAGPQVDPAPAPAPDPRSGDPAPPGSATPVDRGPEPEPEPASTAPADTSTPAAVETAAAPIAPLTIAAHGWSSAPVALDLTRPAGLAERAAAVSSQAQALGALALELRDAGAAARVGAPSRATLHTAVDDLARLAESTRGVLIALAAQQRTLADGLGRVDADAQAARARRDRAAEQRALPSTAPVYPDLPLEQAKVVLERELRDLATERARLAESSASALDAPAGGAASALIAREAERVLELVKGALAEEGGDEALAPLMGVAATLAMTTRAIAGESDQTREGLLELARREREVVRLLEEAASLELERRRTRLDEVTRQVLDQVRRGEETARLARREEELNAQLARLQQALAQAEARAKEEESEIAAVRSRTQALHDGNDPALRTYQTTLEDHDRRLAAARKRRDAARADLEGLQTTITTERDTRAALVMTLRDQIDDAHRAWEHDRDPRPLEELERTLREATAAGKKHVDDLARRVVEANRLADEAQALADQSALEGERRALYVVSAPAAHRPVLASVEEVRGLIESTRREEARHRRSQARALDEARARLQQDLDAVAQDLDDVVAARKATEEARKLNTGALRASWGELRLLALGLRDEAARQREQWRARTDEARGQALRRLGVAAALALAIALLAWRVRRRAAARVEHLLATKVDAERRLIVETAARWSFYAAYLTRDAFPWAALVALPWGLGLVLQLPREAVARATAALGALFLARLLGLFNHLMFRDRLIRSVIPLTESNKRPLHGRLRLALLVFGPLLAAYLLARGIPALWATAVVTRAALAVLVVLTLISMLHVARHDVATLLRLEVAPPDGSGRVLVVEWLKGLYNRVIDDLLALALLDVTAIGTLWVGGYVEEAAFLLRGTVQSSLTLGVALVLVAGLRRLNQRVMKGALATDSARPGVQILLSMAAFIGSRLGELVILACVLLSLYDAWGGTIDPVVRFLLSERFLAGLLAFAKVLGACAAAYYANAAAVFTIDAFVEQTLRTAGSEVARRRDTFAPLVKSAVRYALIMGAIVYSATQAGLDILSILAGLGVLGLAVAFGAQTLVKDVISGVFLIVDDDLAVGDWVMIGAVDGTVEHVGVRTTKLRTVNGVLISIPNGTINEVQNYNRGWNRAVIDLQVPYDANVEMALAVLKEVGEEYRSQRPDLLIEAPEVQGIVSYAESGVSLRLRVKTAPLAVWQVERELRLRALVALEEQGIRIPLSHRVVVLKTAGADGRAVPLDLGAAQPALQARSAPAEVPAPLEVVAPALALREAPPAQPAPAPAVQPVVAAAAAVATPEAAPEAQLVPPEATTPPAVEPEPRPAGGGRTRRMVLSPEARARLADEAYVRAVTAEEPEIPAEMQASREAIERHRQESEAARNPVPEPAPPIDPVAADAAPTDGAPSEPVVEPPPAGDASPPPSGETATVSSGERTEVVTVDLEDPAGAAPEDPGASPEDGAVPEAISGSHPKP